MTNKTETQPQEFTLPFVGREDELKFLLDEYDQMLQAQYRSVWIEAPAGTGKTALVEEFLTRINNEEVKPWVVHAHLRERSSNSLASFVEALGATLQTLTEQRQEKLFSGLTNFYQERAKKIVGGGNVQSMNMEEAMTASGYILKRLSYYFPLVVIIEDLHVLKGEMSFYALRHLQAIMEHVPMMMVFISRPSDEKHLEQFRELSVKEGCRKYEIGSLKHEDVEDLVGAHGVRPTSDVKKLMHLSGGNALLLKELLRSDISDGVTVTGSIPEKIIHYLTKELEKLSKKDRQVVAIAGLLGEEFSEQLLNEITESKGFSCWSSDVLQRLEVKGIIRRGRKILRSETAEKEITIRVSVFAHALWWEAARKFYEKEKVWTDTKFAQRLVSLLSHEDYPLLTDAELIVKFFQWLPRSQSARLLMYVGGLEHIHAKWNFHSQNELIAIFREAYVTIEEMLKFPSSAVTKETMAAMISITNAGFFIFRNQDRTLCDKSFELAQTALLLFPRDKNILKITADVIYSKGFYHTTDDIDQNKFENACNELQKFHKNILESNKSLRSYVKFLLKGFEGFRLYYSDPPKAAKYLLDVAKAECMRNDPDGLSIVCQCLGNIALSAIPEGIIKKSFSSAEEIRTNVAKNYSAVTPYMIQSIFLTDISLSLRLGNIKHGIRIMQEMESLWKEGLLKGGDQLTFYRIQLMVFAYQANKEEGIRTFNVISNSQTSPESKLFIATGKQLFFLEENEQFEKLWDGSKKKIVVENLQHVISLFECRLLMCLLTENNDGVEEILGMMRKLLEDFPMIKNTLQILQKKLNVFLALREKKPQEVKKKFDKFLTSDNTLSPFDKAHYSYLFSRIGVRYGRDPKEFSKYVKNSLKAFAKLGLAKRVVFSAKKFAEVGLLSQVELRKIVKKYHVEIVSEQQVVQEADKKVLDEQNETPRDGVSIHCLDLMKAYDSAGEEIRNQRWGVRNPKLSFHQRVVFILIQAHMENRTVSRKELLHGLFPKLKREKKTPEIMLSVDNTLSVVLSQLRTIFAPNDIFEKRESGYSLHSSVRIDIIELERTIKRAQKFISLHPPSARWNLKKIQDQMSDKQHYFFHRNGLPQLGRTRTDIIRKTNKLLQEAKYVTL